MSARKGEQSFLHVTPSVLISYKLLLKFIKIFVQLPSYGCTSIVCKKKLRKGKKKLRKGGQSFLYLTNDLNHIHIAKKFPQDIPYSYLLMVSTMSVKFHQREVTQKLRKGEQSFVPYLW